MDMQRHPAERQAGRLLRRLLSVARKMRAARRAGASGRDRWLVLGVFLFALLSAGGPAGAEEPEETNGFVGSAACQPCHEQQFRAFQNFARKSRSFSSVEKMAADLPVEKIRPCYGCHTTGYGKPGGFISPELTPELKNVGCEVCHGPARLHVKTHDPARIRRKVTIEICRECHTEERVQAFRYKPILYAGSH